MPGTEPTDSGSPVLATTQPSGLMRLGWLVGTVFLLALGTLVAVQLLDEPSDTWSPFGIVAMTIGMACSFALAVSLARAALGLSAWVELTESGVREVARGGVRRSIALGDLTRIEAQPGPRTPALTADGSVSTTRLDPRRPAIRFTGGEGVAITVPDGRGFAGVREVARRWVEQRPELVQDPVSADQLQR